MSTTLLPEPELALTDLAPLLRVVYPACQAGAQRARETFEQWGVSRPEPYLFGDMVRFHVRRSLGGAGHNSQIDDTFQRKELRNNGLFLVYGNYNLRIWKADHGCLPAPGRSKARRDYLLQRQLPLPLPWPEAQSQGPWNLVVIWSVDGNYDIDELHLVCPKANAIKPDDFDEYWNVIVPDPITAIAPPAPVCGEGDDVEDLDITLPELLATGTETPG